MSGAEYNTHMKTRGKIIVMYILNFVLSDSKWEHNKFCAQNRHLFPELNLISEVFVHEFLIFNFGFGPKYK